jgi:hypothetical protein
VPRIQVSADPSFADSNSQTQAFIVRDMKKVVVLISVMLWCAGLFAQSGNANPAPPAVSADSLPPIITFTETWPEATPPFYTIAVDGSGRVTYRSTPQPANSGTPYDLKFMMLDDTRTKIFDLAKQLKYFRGDFDYKKSRIAFTGTKTLSFQNGQEQHETSYNWSDNLAIQELTKLFQNMSETIELGRMIADKYRFDKLGVDAEMKKLEQATKDDRTAELQAIQPILTKVAKDSNMMNITRRRAESLLAKIPKTAKLNGQQ